jgi:benzylsuccinate CoA-transferase BbsF subunit
MLMNGALSGLRIIDSTAVLAMPTAMHIMADMGAEVIKVESHTVPRTAMGIYPDNDPGPDPWNRESSFHGLNRSKLGLTLNYKTKEGIEAFKDLVRVTDVLAENNRSGVMERLGLGYEELRKVKPDLIYFSNTGFGQTGPWKTYAGIGSMFELTCGLSQFTGYLNGAPRRVGNSWFDMHVGWMAVFAVLAALHHRQKTGEGQWVDYAMYQIGVSTIGDAILDYIANGRNGKLMGNRHPFMAPQGVYPCRGNDKWIAIAIENDDQWNALCQVTGNPDWTRDPKFGDGLSRWHNQDPLDQFIGQWTKGYDHTELMNLLQKAGVPATAVMNSKEQLTDPHLQARDYYERVTHPPESRMGTRAYASRPWKMSKTPAFIRRLAPRLGEHNELILGELLGHSDADISKLYELGVLGKEPTTPTRARNESPVDEQVERGELLGYDTDYNKILGFE